MAGSGVFAETIDGDVFKYYADGEWKKSSSGKSVSIINPTTRKTQYKVQVNKQGRSEQRKEKQMDAPVRRRRNL
ncbi:hypothetical protein LOK49_LG14G02025 [Camellia lanceoleosa]|uniref:Uncharacterized protein n=1 Tax=Camellia lanceoleosa TaxID=1840588 RepID=A0ACC0FE69_9ERIC|nr:hypothetical protein LOK49_LG14G02025 [Camellia lanceoleosa]